MKIPHNKLSFDEAEVQAVQDIVRSGQWACGPVVEKTEAALANIFGTGGAVCVGSGLSAIRIALLALGVGKGDEVLIPAYSCVALANAVLSIGAIAVVVDVDIETFNISASTSKEKITEKTKAIIAVNTFGIPVDIAGLKALNVPVIEDCSHGFAVSDISKPKKLESDVAIFSFYATKLIAGGEGGAILSNSDDIISVSKDWRDYTDKKPNANRLNDKITDIEAGLVLEQLKKLEKTLEHRHQIGKIYDELLDNTSLSDNRVWYRYTLLLNEVDLSQVIQKLDEKGVAARVPVENWLGKEIEKFPKAQKLFDSILSLPLYPSLTVEEQQYVTATLKEVL